jgi:hypothetical protein
LIKKGLITGKILLYLCFLAPFDPSKSIEQLYYIKDMEYPDLNSGYITEESIQKILELHILQ